ncbi:MAG: hypothetical protein H0V66_00175 [Bdellovibrionales bacterium]|nr:hypothetical protein [Bdellovibrionales bacterium]
MKTLILALALSLSTSAFARQYIQCSATGDTTDVAVVNLTTEAGGTLFLSSGMQNPEDERILVNIELDSIEGQHHIYKVINESGEASVSVPSQAIGKSSNFVLVDLIFAGSHYQYSCFSRIYND